MKGDFYSAPPRVPGSCWEGLAQTHRYGGQVRRPREGSSEGCGYGLQTFHPSLPIPSQRATEEGAGAICAPWDGDSPQIPVLPPQTCCKPPRAQNHPSVPGKAPGPGGAWTAGRGDLVSRSETLWLRSWAEEGRRTHQDRAEFFSHPGDFQRALF